MKLIFENLYFHLWLAYIQHLFFVGENVPFFLFVLMQYRQEFHRIYKQDKILLILVLTFFVVGRKVNHTFILCHLKYIDRWTKEYTNMNLWFIMFEFVLVHNLKKKKKSW